jgi:LysR family transcriptional regulator, hydrogen peroxide-inducible genes activator
MTPLPSFKQLQYLVALSEHLNFTRAAEACFVTQSTLSAGLKELEDLLGVTLVERNRQSVLMTPLGLEVASRARGVLAALRDLVEVAGEAGQPMSGLLHLGVIPTIAPFLLPATLHAARQRYPNLQLALREDRTASLLQRLESGELDFALIALPYDTGNLRVEPLFDDELWLIGAKTDPQLQAEPIRLTNAIAQRLLLLAEGHCLREHALAACKTGPGRSAEAVEATSLLTLVQMVESGLGVGLIPAMAAHGGLLASGTLVAKPLHRPIPKRTVALVARPSTTRQAEFAALAQLIRQVRPGS